MLFDRSASLLLGKPGAPSTLVSGLKITFDVSRDYFATCNTAKIKVYGLSQGTRDSIKQYETYMQLTAGYKQDAGELLVFSGEVYAVSHDKEPPEVITSLTSGDGFGAIRETRGAVSFPPGSAVADVISNVAQQLGLPLKTPPQTTATFPKGFAAVGPMEDILRRAMAAGGLEHSIQDGMIQAVPRRTSTNDSPILVSEATGMIGSPKQMVDGEFGMLALQPLTIWRVRCLLNPRIYPRRQVTVVSESCNGTFICRSVRHCGDTFGDDWYTEAQIAAELF